MDETPKKLIPFTPVTGSNRHDGWTVARQRAFVEALAETGCVQDACRRVGMSETSARALRRRDPYFAEAWEAALELGLDRLEDAALARSIKGAPRPIFYKGEQVGEWRHHDERLTMFLLSHRKAARFGKWIDRTVEPPQRTDHNGLTPGMRMVHATDFFADDDDDAGEGPGEGA